VCGVATPQYFGTRIFSAWRKKTWGGKMKKKTNIPRNVGEFGRDFSNSDNPL